MISGAVLEIVGCIGIDGLCVSADMVVAAVDHKACQKRIVILVQILVPNLTAIGNAAVQLPSNCSGGKVLQGPCRGVVIDLVFRITLAVEAQTVGLIPEYIGEGASIAVRLLVAHDGTSCAAVGGNIAHIEATRHVVILSAVPAVADQTAG